MEKKILTLRLAIFYNRMFNCNNFLVAEGRGGLNYLWVTFIGLMIFGAIKTLLQRW